MITKKKLSDSAENSQDVKNWITVNWTMLELGQRLMIIWWQLAQDKKILWSQDHLITRSKDHIIIRSQITKSHDHKITWSQDHMITRSHDHKITWLQDHMITKSKDHFD